MPCLLSRGLLLPWLTAASLRPRRPSSHLLLPLAFLPSSSKDPCGNLGPSQVIQGTVPMATVVTASAKFPLLCKVTGSQAPGLGRGHLQEPTLSLPALAEAASAAMSHTGGHSRGARGSKAGPEGQGPGWNTGCLFSSLCFILTTDHFSVEIKPKHNMRHISTKNYSLFIRYSLATCIFSC